MKGSLKIGAIAGVPIRLHWSLVILVLFAVGRGMTASMVLSEACRVHLFVQCPDLELHGAPACGYDHR
jgi:hypothetical protein